MSAVIDNSYEILGESRRFDLVKICKKFYYLDLVA